MILKVMSGDKFNLSVYSYWNGGTPNNPVSPLTDLVNALSNNVGSVAGNHGTSSELQTSGVFTSGATSFLNGQSYTSGRPKAYINWILFDEYFTYVSSSSGFSFPDESHPGLMCAGRGLIG
jgi:hypothetical protein